MLSQQRPVLSDPRCHRANPGVGSTPSSEANSVNRIVDTRTLDRGTPTGQTAPVVPDTRYAKSGDIHIAYQVVGDGPIDLVFLPGLFSQVEHQWEEPSFAHFLGRLASFSRLIPIDARGTGLSDRAPVLPPMEEQMDDVLAVLDEVGSSSAAFLGLSQAGPMAMLFAASHPQRTKALVLYGTYATPRQRNGYPWGRTAEWMEDYERLIDRKMGFRSLSVAGCAEPG